MENARYLNVKLLARRWGISPRTLDRWRREGRGPMFVKMGGRVSYRLDDIEAFEASRRRACMASGSPALLASAA